MLKGSALSAIAEIPLTSENYSLVVKLLQERFGQKEAIVESLYFKLQNLQMAFISIYFPAKVGIKCCRFYRNLCCTQP